MPALETPTFDQLAALPPDRALTATLKALGLAIQAAASVGNCTSEAAREFHVAEVDRHLARAADCIAELAKAAADHPTLFGRKVGDGLSEERGQARVAINILRLLVNGTEGQPPLLVLTENVTGPFLAAAPGHLRLALAQNERALLDALKAE